MMCYIGNTRQSMSILNVEKVFDPAVYFSNINDQKLSVLD